MMKYNWHKIDVPNSNTFHCDLEMCLLVVSQEPGYPDVWYWGSFAPLKDGGCRLVPQGLCRTSKEEAMGAAQTWYCTWMDLR